MISRPITALSSACEGEEQKGQNVHALRISAADLPQLVACSIGALSPLYSVSSIRPAGSVMHCAGAAVFAEVHACAMPAWSAHCRPRPFALASPNPHDTVGDKGFSRSSGSFERINA